MLSSNIFKNCNFLFNILIRKSLRLRQNNCSLLETLVDGKMDCDSFYPCNVLIQLYSTDYLPLYLLIGFLNFDNKLLSFLGKKIK